MNMHERIYEKANELFTKYGIKRITMDEIAARLGISKKTIYQSFADKNALVAEVFDRSLLLSHQKCLHDIEISENAVHEILLGSKTFCNDMQVININVLYDLEKYHPEIYKKFVDYKNDFLYSCIIQNLHRGIEEGLYKKDINVEVITRLRMSTVVLALNIELFPAAQFQFAEVERELTLHFLNGLVTAAGAEVLQQYTHPSTVASEMFY